jgi:hypothetical protein
MMVVDKHGSSDWQLFNLTGPIFLGRCGANQLKILHHLAGCDAKLMCVDDAGEVLTLPQASGSLPKEILILRNENPAKFRRPLQ